MFVHVFGNSRHVLNVNNNGDLNRLDEGKKNFYHTTEALSSP